MVIGRKSDYGYYMLYRAGWFVLIDDKDKTVSVMTREDARLAESDSKWYNYRMNCDRGGQPEDPAFERLFKKDSVTGRDMYQGKYEVDTLASPSLDVKIGKKLVIPEYVGEFRVNRIYRRTFQYLDIESLVLPGSIETIEWEAFKYCACLENVKMSPGTVIERGAFTDCPAFMNQSRIIITDGTVVQADGAIPEKLTLPDEVTSIGGSAFGHNKSLKEITINEGCTYIGSHAFEHCPNLEKVIFPSHMSKIEWWAFIGCQKLKAAHLPEGIKKIPQYLFHNCESLSEVTIPESVENVVSSAFEGTLIEKRFLGSDDPVLYIGKWAVRFKDHPGELVIKEGTVGVAAQSFQTLTIEKVTLPSSLKHLSYSTFAHSSVHEIDLGGVEIIGYSALADNPFKCLHIPESCRQFLANNVKNSVTIEDIYFYNPSTHIDDDAIGERLDNASIRIHGYAGSTAEEYCRKYGEKYNLIFVEI